MNLQETIDALDKQAARYTEAANALRVLLGQESSPSVAPLEAQPETEAEVTEEVKAAPAPRRRGRKPGPKPKKGRGNRGPVSAETRAKISEALRASHARRALAQQAAKSTE